MLRQRGILLVDSLHPAALLFRLAGSLVAVVLELAQAGALRLCLLQCRVGVRFRLLEAHRPPLRLHPQRPLALRLVFRTSLGVHRRGVFSLRVRKLHLQALELEVLRRRR